MTLEQYILNPMGKNNAVLNATTREIIRSNYMKKFDAVLLRENGKIDYNLYYDKKNNAYWAHIKVPSEIVKNFYYDVVFKFTATQSVEEGGENLFKYNVNFFSNDPAFVYTYAHVFIKNEIFISELTKKMSKQAVKKDAVEKNPTHDVGYVKAIYFAYLYMVNKKINKVSRFTAEAKPFNLANLLKDIEDADIKIAKRQEEGAKKEKKRTSNSVSTGASAKELSGDKFSKNILKTSTVSKISSGISRVGSISKVKNTKKK